jgi:carbamoyl-phosphate synthase large subunit
MKSGEIHLLINTPSGGESSAQSADIRKTAIAYKIPYITTTAAAIAAARGIAARREGRPKVRSVQQYHSEIH